MPFGPGDRILTHRVEYASNYVAMLQVAQRTGAVIEIVPSTATGEIDVGALAGMLDDRVRLVAITHVPTSGGLVNPAAAVGRRLAGTGIPYLLDACQSVGQLPIDVDAIGCTFLTTTGRKFLRGRAAPASSTSLPTGSSGSNPTSSTCARPTGPRRAPTSCGPTSAASNNGSGAGPDTSVSERQPSTR